ncbi:hypothetical protein [Pseudomonas asiatica]|uniref:hypothetical protein n=1 Tax=Pseudomonas asiatica TaxID=2219225 RepID=UPI003877BDBF
MFPLETFDENGKPQHFVKQATVVALQSLIAKAKANPGGFASEVTADEAQALIDLGDSKTKMEV